MKSSSAFVPCFTSIRTATRMKFVPKCSQPNEEMTSKLNLFVNSSKHLLIVTGAGISTESGIPDYRSEEVGLYARKNYKPMQYKDFISSDKFRQRYWARSFIGWTNYSSIQPSTPHKVLNDWEQSNKLHWLVTQNVDHLHNKAGSKRISELHGTLYEVGCLDCSHTVNRHDYQKDLKILNKNWSVQSFEMGTDGDVFLTDEQIQGFQVKPCAICGGPMKPKIVFFGDNVSRSLVEFIHEKVRQSDSILVLGSSLQVYSAYRFIHAAAQQRKPIAIVNVGPTRGDKEATLKIEARCGDILPLLKVQNDLTNN